MKKISVFLTLLFIIALFVGCENSNDDTAETTTDITNDGNSDKDDTTTIKSNIKMKMLWWSDGIEGDIMQTILDDYKAKTGVEIEMVSIAYDIYSTKLRTMMVGGEAPELIRATEGHIGELKDYLVGLDSAFDASEFTNVYYNKSGEAISLPMEVTANGLMVNYDLLDKYGVDYPRGGETWTWAEFESEMSNLKGRDDVAYPGAFDGKAHRFMPMVYQFGGKLWNTLYTDSALTEEPAVEALTTLQRFSLDGMIDPAVWVGSANASELFRTGKYGFHMGGSWNVAEYQDLPFSWGVVPMPIGNGANATRSTILGGKAICALKDSGNEEEALKFIEYLSKAENHDKFASGVPFLSPRLGASLDFGGYQAAYDVFQDEISNTPLENVADWQAQVEISGMYPIIDEAVVKAMVGQDVKETLQQLANDLMDKAKEMGL